MLKPAWSDATQGVFGYMALYADFGEHEHIFSPVRPSVCTLRTVLTWISCGWMYIAEEVGAEEQGRLLATFAGGKKDCPERDVVRSSGGARGGCRVKEVVQWEFIVAGAAMRPS